MHGLSEYHHHGAPRGLMGSFVPDSVKKDSFWRRRAFDTMGCNVSVEVLGRLGSAEIVDFPMFLTHELAGRWRHCFIIRITICEDSPASLEGVRNSKDVYHIRCMQIPLPR